MASSAAYNRWSKNPIISSLDFGCSICFIDASLFFISFRSQSSLASCTSTAPSNSFAYCSMSSRLKFGF